MFLNNMYDSAPKFEYGLPYNRYLPAVSVRRVDVFAAVTSLNIDFLVFQFFGRPFFVLLRIERLHVVIL